MRRYISRVFGRAWADTLSDLSLDNPRRVIVNIALATLTVVVLARVGWAEILISHVGGFIAVLIAFILLLPLVFVVNLIAAPARMQLETDQTVEELQRSFHERRLTVSPKWVDKAGTGRRHFVTLHVKNETSRTVKSVIATVENIEPISGTAELDEESASIVGKTLGLSGRVDHHLPIPYSVDLHPGAETSFEVAFVDKAPTGPSFRLAQTMLMYAANGEPHHSPSGNRRIPAGHYKVTVVVRGEDAPQRSTQLLFKSTSARSEVSEA